MTIDSEVERILMGAQNRFHSEQTMPEARKEAAQAITNLIAQEANKAKLEILERLSCCDYEPIGDKAEINVCNGDHLKLVKALTADKEQA